MGEKKGKIEAKEMVVKRIHFFFLSVLLLLVPFDHGFLVFAGSDFRCSGRIIHVGDTQDFVLDKCGPPTSIEERTERFARGFRQRYPESHEELNYIISEIQIEVWTYNLGRTQFIRYLTFKNRKLTRIETGDYGY